MGEINVAYDGTSADLGVGGDMSLFSNSINWEDVFGSTDNLPTTAAFTAINNDGVNNGTVSPKDLFQDNSSSSMPPSTSFTNLTTPGSAMLDTPDEAYETSPLFNDSFTADASNDSWFPLFPATETNSPPAMTRTTSSTSQVLVHPGGDLRKRSSVNASPITPNVRASSVAGVRKREKPLPPIIVDENDTVALKRARNTAAARKSRDKKVRERETLESRIAELEAEVEHWKSLALAHS
ncbi:General control protein [Zalaria obscura]|uniref:General control protein n=1 Tax=Zalaria obscura TaxID=2024903 RepID=A0ACC3S609_9PEZI